MAEDIKALQARLAEVKSQREEVDRRLDNLGPSSSSTGDRGTSGGHHQHQQQRRYV